jgi:glutamate synthase (NADPH/NADH) large chain
LGSDHIPADKPQFSGVERNPPFDKGLLAEKMVELASSAIQRMSGAEYDLDICNCDRSIGARISGEIARKHGNQGHERKRRSPSASRARPGRASACGTPAA